MTRKASGFISARTGRRFFVQSLPINSMIQESCRRSSRAFNVVKGPRDGRLPTCSRSELQFGFRQNLQTLPNQHEAGTIPVSCGLWSAFASSPERAAAGTCSPARGGGPHCLHPVRVPRSRHTIHLGSRARRLDCRNRSCSVKPESSPSSLRPATEIGGISRTVRYKGNRMDIGGHRFFSNPTASCAGWLELMPVEAGAGQEASRAGSCATRASSAIFPGPLRLPTRRLKIWLCWSVSARVASTSCAGFFDYPSASPQPHFESRPGTHVSLRRQLLRSALCLSARSIRSKTYHQSIWQAAVPYVLQVLHREVWVYPATRSAPNGAPSESRVSRSKAWWCTSSRRPSAQTNRRYRSKADRDLAHREVSYPKFGPGQLWEHAADLVRGAAGRFIRIHDRPNSDHGQTVTAIEGVNKGGERVHSPATIFSPPCPSAIWCAPSPRPAKTGSR